MKSVSALKVFAGGLAAVFVIGCATERANWDNRVGHYTFDQAVTDLGPPDKQAKLGDGSIVADWISRYYNGGTAYVGAGVGYAGSGASIVTPPMYSESTLRLTFSTNHVLTTWSKD